MVEGWLGALLFISLVSFPFGVILWLDALSQHPGKGLPLSQLGTALMLLGALLFVLTIC